jgi:thiol-disulfide isomerase/thioredoxin
MRVFVFYVAALAVAGDDGLRVEEECTDEPLDIEDGMAVLSAASFDDFVKNDVSLVLFHDTAGLTTGLRSNLFEDLAGALSHASPPIRVGKMDGGTEENKKIAEVLQVTSFPTLKWFWRGRPYTYDGSLELTSMVQHFQTRAHVAREKVSPAVKRLSEATFNDTSHNQPLMLVEFFAPWCGHCKSFAPTFEGAAEVLRGEDIMMVEIDGPDSPALRKQYNVSGYPTLKIFRYGIPYEVPRMNHMNTIDLIVTYISEQIQPAWSVVRDSSEIDELFQKKTFSEAKSYSDRIVLFCVSDNHSAQDDTMRAIKHVTNSLRDHVGFARSISEEALCQAIGPHESISVVMDHKFSSVYELSVQSSDIGAFNVAEKTLRFANGNKVGIANEILDWVRDRLPPLVGFLTSLNFEVVWKRKRPLLVAFCEGDFGTDFLVQGSSLRQWREQNDPASS